MMNEVHFLMVVPNNSLDRIRKQEGKKQSNQPNENKLIYLSRMRYEKYFDKFNALRHVLRRKRVKTHVLNNCEKKASESNAFVMNGIESISTQYFFSLCFLSAFDGNK